MWLASISRCMNDVITPEHAEAATRFRELLAAYTEREDEISLGAYARGSNHSVDRAMEMMDEMNAFLKQGIYEKDDLKSIVNKLVEMFSDRTGMRAGRGAAQQPPAFARIVR